MNIPPTEPFAGFGARLVAALIDGVVLLVAGYVISFVFKSLGFAVDMLFQVGYFVYLEGGPSGQTLGKRVVNIRVVSADSTGSIGFVRAFVRYIISIFSGMFLFVGYLWMLWDPDKQTWHDKLSNAYVIVPSRVTQSHDTFNPVA